MGPKVPQPVSVGGGSNGVDAHYEEIVALARLFGRVATDGAGSALTLHAYLLDPGIYTSGLLDPAGVANFEADLLDALDGHHGLTWIAAQCALIDSELRAAAAAYQEADRLAIALQDHLGAFVGVAPSTLHAVQLLMGTGNLPRSLQTVLTDDPALVDTIMNSGLITVAGALAPLYADGHAKVTEYGIDNDPIAALPPRNLADTVTGLALRNQGRPGEIDVRILTGADGTRHVIVDIPGTKSWDPLPTSDITSLSTNVRSLSGETTAYERGVLTAMQRAGVQPTDNVMLVGHSEGGMVAVMAAAHCAKSHRFTISHVVTAGAPIGRTVTRLPGNVQVLALENANDVVFPHLDGATNPDRVNVTIVTTRRGDGTILDDHDLTGSYLPGAADVDASTNPSVRSFLAGASGFFGAARVETHTFVITRRY